jgi:hypothetical protein
MQRGRPSLFPGYTDKKEKKCFPICKEIQMGAIKIFTTKSFKSFLICEEMLKYLVIYEEATSDI